MHKIIKKLRVTIRWILAAFFGSTILAVVALRFLPVYFTPLMFIRLAQQAGEGRELRLSHHWVPLNDISPYMPVAVIASEDANFMSWVYSMPESEYDYQNLNHYFNQHPENVLGKLALTSGPHGNVVT